MGKSLYGHSVPPSTTEIPRAGEALALGATVLIVKSLIEENTLGSALIPENMLGPAWAASIVVGGPLH